MKRTKCVLRTAALYATITVAIGALLSACSTGNKNNEAVVKLEADAVYLDILAIPPSDLASRTVAFEDQAKFAWQEFLALNYKAEYNPIKPPGTRGPRGTPDTEWTYGDQSTGAHPDTVVWETYAHKTELRPWFVPMKPFDDDPHYSYGEQESFVQGKNAAGGPANLFLLNLLDENNEIGRNDMFTAKDHNNFILYQVKVNRDEYDYILNTYPPKVTGGAMGGPKVWKDLSTAAANGLPAKTSSSTPKEYDPSAYYKGVKDMCDCPPEAELICLPCGGSSDPNTAGSTFEGAIEIKAAYRRLQDDEDPKQFFTTDAVYFEKSKDEKSMDDVYTYNNDVFALIGIHIIHKTKNFPDFVFATWEHISLEEPAGQYEYVELDQNAKPAKGPTGKLYNPVVRLHPIDPRLEEINKQVHAQLKSLNPAVVWQYYQLVGVQAAVDGALNGCTTVYNPTDVPLSGVYTGMETTTDANHCIETTNDPNYYQANFVIESDLGFVPQVPKHAVPGLMTFNGSGFNPYPYVEGKNILYDGQLHNLGGCKGCHGVAQIGFGTDFSFLLDSGNGKPTSVPDFINAPDPIKSDGAARAVELKKTRAGYMK